MDAVDCILSRRSVRRFSELPVEFEKLVKILQAGHSAPSAGNLQPWKFIVVLDKEKIRSLYDYALEQEAFLSAQICVVVLSDQEVMERYYGVRGSRLYSVQSCAAAVENMLLAAHALGLGGVWVGAFDEDAVSSLFGVSKGFRVQALLLFGYPAEKPGDKDSKDLFEVVYFEEFGRSYTNLHLFTRDYSVEWDKRLREAKSFFERLGESLGKGVSAFKRELKKENKKEKK